MTCGYQRLDQKPYESHYRYFETTIDHPVEKVWPHVLDIGGWMSDHRLVPLAGEAGQMGYFEQVFARDVGNEVSLAHHHYYGIAQIVPFKYIALEVFPEMGGSYGNPRDWIGFDGIFLVDLGGRTCVIVLLLIVHPQKGPDSPPNDGDEEATSKQLNRYFENLKRLVASR